MEIDGFQLIDARENPIYIGSLVSTESELEFVTLSQQERTRLVTRWNISDEERKRYTAPNYVPMPAGTVQKVSDFDGDVDDDTMRSIQINPYVYVKWPDAEEIESFSTYVESYRDMILMCEDLVVIPRDHNNERG